ncbi:MAG: signal recognition particle-docking protein FtsY [Acidimicrobiales bacterium]
MITLLIIVGALVVVLAVGAFLIRRRSVPLEAPPRSAMPSVLVEETKVMPSLVNDEPTLAGRLSSSRGVFERLRSIATTASLSAEQLNLVEEVLLRSDVGLATTTDIVELLRVQGAPDGVARAVSDLLLASFKGDRSVVTTAEDGRIPVWLFVGVNGVGKTTTIGKLAKQHRDAGRSVLLAAGDTFRAAAADQLEQWAKRTGADIVRANEGADPGSVVHDAIGRAKARSVDIVLADTAGRRANSSNLLDELAKVRRVADRAPGRVVETLLVLDATTGQNALSQAREFLAASGVTGIVLTKLDGTARGGVVVAIERDLGVPVKYVGVGEGVDDLVIFDPVAFVDSLLKV